MILLGFGRSSGCVFSGWTDSEVCLNVDRAAMVSDLMVGRPWVREIALPDGETGFAVIAPYNARFFDALGVTEVISGAVFTNASLSP